MKDYLIRKMAVKMMISEKTLEAVINHQFTSANQAMLTNNSVEISGFGKFLFNEKKAAKKLETMYIQKQHLERTLSNPEASEQRKRSAQMKLDSLNISIDILKPRVDEYKARIRGMEEQASTTLPSEGTDRENE